MNGMGVHSMGMHDGGVYAVGVGAHSMGMHDGGVYAVGVGAQRGRYFVDMHGVDLPGVGVQKT
jgi:hypothetical protein